MALKFYERFLARQLSGQRCRQNGPPKTGKVGRPLKFSDNLDFIQKWFRSVSNILPEDHLTKL